MKDFESQIGTDCQNKRYSERHQDVGQTPGCEDVVVEGPHGVATINDQLPTGDKEVIVEDVGDDLGVDNNKNPYTCDTCFESFFQKSQLLNHKENQHSFFSCRETKCEAFFKQKAQLKKHYEIKHDRNCPYCYIYKSRYSELEKHVLEHAEADQNKFLCEKCSMTLPTKKAYQKHFKHKHTPHCSRCNKSFSTQSGLNQHARDKHGFTCIVCTMNFTHKEAYQQHLNTAHTKSQGTLGSNKGLCYFGKLRNRHTDCFCNTLVHKLANIDLFRDYIMNLSSDSLENKPVSKTLKKIFKDMSSNPSAKLDLVEAFELRTLVDAQTFDDDGQHDIMDFANGVLAAVAYEELKDRNIIANKEYDKKILEDVIRNEIGDSVIRKMFFWVTENVFQCKTTDCNITYSRFETLSHLKVNIPNEITDDEYKKLNDTEKNIFDNERTLEACYENYFKTDTSRDEKFECEICEKESPAIALHLIHTVPDVIEIVLIPFNL